MLRFVQLLTVAATVFFGRVALAGEDAAADTQSAQPGAAATDPQAGKQPTPSEDSNRPDKWRYRLHNGRWWYWTASNHWLIWNEGQGWVAHQPPAAQTPAPATRAPAPATRAPVNDSWRWGWDPANPFDRHPPGRPFNSPKVFPRNM